MPMPALRRLFTPFLVCCALLTGAAAPTAAQSGLDLSAECALGCSALRFNLFTGPTPMAFNSLELSLTGGWTFSGAFFTALDEFGSFDGMGTIGAGGASVFLNFVEDPGWPFELSNDSHGYVQLGANGSGDIALSWSATDAGGGVHTGSFGTPPTNVVPEPVSMVLLGTGMAGVGLVRRRRRGVGLEG